MIPSRIQRDGTRGLIIEWPDGTLHTLHSRLLRTNCPAADSRAERGDNSHSKPLTTPVKASSLQILKSTIDEQLELQKIWGVGNYAIGIAWADGHKTGIYSFDLLWKLGEQEKLSAENSNGQKCT